MVWAPSRTGEPALVRVVQPARPFPVAEWSPAVLSPHPVPAFHPGPPVQVTVWSRCENGSNVADQGVGPVRPGGLIPLKTIHKVCRERVEVRQSPGAARSGSRTANGAGERWRVAERRYPIHGNGRPVVSGGAAVFPRHSGLITILRWQGVHVDRTPGSAVSAGQTGPGPQGFTSGDACRVPLS